MLGGIRAKALHKGTRAQPHAYGSGYGSSGGRAVGAAAALPNLVDLVSRTQAPPSPDVSPTEADPDLMDKISGQYGDMPPALIATPDTEASNTVMSDQSLHNTAPSVQNAANAARAAQDSGMPPAATRDRTFDEMKQQMIGEYRQVLSRAQAKRAAAAEQEKEWGGFGGKIAEMFGGVAQFRMQRRNQMNADINAEDQLANDLAERINGSDKVTPVTGGYIDRMGNFQRTALDQSTSRILDGTDANGNPVKYEVRVPKAGTGAPAITSLAPPGGGSMDTKGSLQADKLEATDKNNQANRDSRESIAADKLAELARHTNIWKQVVDGKMTQAHAELLLKQQESGRKAASTDVRTTTTFDTLAIKDLQKKAGDQNATADDRANAEAKAAHMQNTARNRPKVSDVVKPKASAGVAEDWKSIPIGKRFRDTTDGKIYRRTAEGRVAE